MGGRGILGLAPGCSGSKDEYFAGGEMFCFSLQHRVMHPRWLSRLADSVLLFGLHLHLELLSSGAFF